MRRFSKSALASGLTLTMCVVTAAANAQEPATVPDAGRPVYRVDVVSRTIRVVNFHHRQGSTSLDLKGTALAPNARGNVKVDSKTGATKVEVYADKLPPPRANGEEFSTYVVWAITPEGRPENLGELAVENGDSAKLQAATELQNFGLLVTAEPYFAVTQPSDVIVMEAVINKDTTGSIAPMDAKYELWPKGMYAKRLPEAQRIWNVKTGKPAPSALVQAREAMAIARSYDADKYAADTMRKADVEMQNAEAFFGNKGDTRKIQTLARNVTQLAEDARLISVKRAEEDRLEAERKSAADRLAAAQTEAEQETRKRELAESERKLALEREQNARLRAEEEAAERRRLEKEKNELAEARAAAVAAQRELETQKAELASQAERSKRMADEAEEARRRAEADRARAREELRQQLNSVLETRETARGLIVNMSDVLFASGKYTLMPGTREKLAKISGIVMAHPDLKLEIEGHTDSVGGDDYNQKLSEHRASAVKDYLIEQGVKADSVSAKGFGKTQPVADNSTAAGRQRNRRVEIVVSGESIQTTTSTGSTVSSRQ